MIIFIFGNQDLPQDSLPLKLLPALRKGFPKINFLIKDPNEEWETPDDITVIDTVVGIDKVQVFTDLKTFVSAPRVTLHDFDALTNLKYLQKIGKLKKIKIIGIPPSLDEGKALNEVASILRASLP